MSGDLVSKESTGLPILCIVIPCYNEAHVLPLTAP